MRIRSFLIASVAVAALTSSAFATNLGRCENLDPLVTQNPDIVSYKTTSSNPNVHASGSPKCGPFVPAGVRACPDVGPGGSLSLPVSPAMIVKVSTPQAPTITPQYREGELDKRDYAKAVLAELIDAIKEHRQPQPVPEGPYIDWEAAQVGSCS
jgi:hypothetical protein